MPRSGWLAIGGTIAALTAPSLGSAVVPVAAAMLMAIVVVLLSAVPAGKRRTLVLACAVGALLVTVRIALGPGPTTATPAPDGEGPWTMLVETVGSRADSVATWLDQREPQDLLEEVKRFARRRPGVFLAIAAGAIPQTTWFLYAVSGIKDHWRAGFLHPRYGPHVVDEHSIAESRAPFRQ